MSRAPAPPDEPFRCDVHPGGGCVRVCPVGELDIATVPEVHRRLRDLRDAGFDHLVIDLRETTFMDSSGLRLILLWNEEATRDGTDFAVIAGGDEVRRVFSATRVDERLKFAEPDREAGA